MWKAAALRPLYYLIEPLTLIDSHSCCRPLRLRLCLYTEGQMIPGLLILFLYVPSAELCAVLRHPCYLHLQTLIII